MRNKYLILLTVTFFFLFNINFVFAEQLNIKSTKITLDKKSQTMSLTGSVEVADEAYTVTNADGTKEQKSFEYPPKTLEQIFAEATKLADGETFGTKFEDRLYTVASDEGKEKAKFDRIKAELSGQDANVTTTDVSNLLKEAEQGKGFGRTSEN